MKTWMLWYDDQGDIVERVIRAANYYEKKYLCRPNLCLIAHGEIPGELMVNGIRVISDRRVARKHLWIGYEAIQGDENNDLL